MVRLCLKTKPNKQTRERTLDLIVLAALHHRNYLGGLHLRKRSVAVKTRAWLNKKLLCVHGKAENA